MLLPGLGSIGLANEFAELVVAGDFSANPGQAEVAWVGERIDFGRMAVRPAAISEPVSYMPPAREVNHATPTPTTARELAIDGAFAARAFAGGSFDGGVFDGAGVDSDSAGGLFGEVALPLVPAYELPDIPAPQLTSHAGASFATGSRPEQAQSQFRQNPSASLPNANATGSASAIAGEPAVDDAAPELLLVDLAGNAIDVTGDTENTIVVSADTGCAACGQLKAELQAPAAAEALAGLQIVFALGDEGGAGPGGVLYADYLDNLPGEAAFLAENSVRPDAFPYAFNFATGQFDTSAADAINAWLDRSTNTPAPPIAALHSGHSTQLPGDFG